MSTSDTVRATFVMRKSSRNLLKGVARRYGVSQSEIMNTAPFLFIVMAERSLRARRSELAKAHTLAAQARRSLDAMPRHLVLGDAQESIDEAIKLEEGSIRQHQVHGPDEADIEETMARAFMPFGDPLRETVNAALMEVGAKTTAQQYKSMLDKDDFEDSFTDEEEQARMDEILDSIGDLDLTSTDDKAPDAVTDSSSEQRQGVSRHGPWNIYLKDGEIEADNGGEALAQFLRYLVDEDRSRLNTLQTVKGRVRPLIADEKEQLYPGRPDLADFAREFVPGWFVGTNYSHRDVMRLLQKAADAAGLVWGVDVYVKAAPSGES